MAMIRDELGADALILSSRRVSGGVEIAACLDPQEDDPAPPPSRAHAVAPVESPLAQAQWLPRPPSRTTRGAPRPDPLLWHGVPAALAARLDGGNLARAFGESLRFGTLPLGERAPLILLGAPGAGKTLTTARLATRLVLAGQLPLVISADGRRAGAAEELAAYTRLLGIELIVASKAATIVRALPRRAAGAPVLIDTAGVNPFDHAQMQSVFALVAAANALPVLVLAAGQDANESAEQAEIYAAEQVEHLIPSRLDVTRRARRRRRRSACRQHDPVGSRNRPRCHGWADADYARAAGAMAGPNPRGCTQRCRFRPGRMTMTHPAETPPRLTAIASGKGGVGKTWFAITLAHAWSRLGRRVLLFDGDLGLANIDIQLGLPPRTRSGRGTGRAHRDGRCGASASRPGLLGADRAIGQRRARRSGSW